MSEINPYAAPMSENPTVEGVIFDGGIYSANDGRLLVIDKRVDLPPEICVKSNLKASGTLVRKLHWHHPAVYFTLLLNILIYAVVAMVTTKKAKIHIGMSEEWFAKRRFRLVAVWLTIVLSILTIILSVSYMVESNDASELWILLMLGAMLALVIAAIAGIVSTRMVYPQKITDTHIFLRGAHRDYALRYPPWAGDI